jgi:hypothetical protein
MDHYSSRCLLIRHDAKAQRQRLGEASIGLTGQRLPHEGTQMADHFLPPGRGKSPLYQHEGAFFLILAATHLYPGGLCRLAQLDVQVGQQALAIKVPAHFQREIIQTHHGIEEEGIVIRPLIGGSNVTFEDEAARAGFPT